MSISLLYCLEFVYIYINLNIYIYIIFFDNLWVMPAVVLIPVHRGTTSSSFTSSSAAITLQHY